MDKALLICLFIVTLVAAENCWSHPPSKIPLCPSGFECEDCVVLTSCSFLISEDGETKCASRFEELVGDFETEITFLNDCSTGLGRKPIRFCPEFVDENTGFDPDMVETLKKNIASTSVNTAIDEVTSTYKTVSQVAGATTTNTVTSSAATALVTTATAITIASTAAIFNGATTTDTVSSATTTSMLSSANNIAFFNSTNTSIYNSVSTTSIYNSATTTSIYNSATITSIDNSATASIHSSAATTISNASTSSASSASASLVSIGSKVVTMTNSDSNTFVNSAKISKVFAKSANQRSHMTMTIQLGPSSISATSSSFMSSELLMPSTPASSMAQLNPTTLLEPSMEITDSTITPTTRTPKLPISTMTPSKTQAMGPLTNTQTTTSKYPQPSVLHQPALSTVFPSDKGNHKSQEIALMIIASVAVIAIASAILYYMRTLNHEQDEAIEMDILGRRGDEEENPIEFQLFQMQQEWDDVPL